CTCSNGTIERTVKECILYPSQAMRERPYFSKRSLSASRNRSWTFISFSSPICFNCRETAGSKNPAIAFFPSRLWETEEETGRGAAAVCEAGPGAAARPLAASKALDRDAFFFMFTILPVYMSTCKEAQPPRTLCPQDRTLAPSAHSSAHACTPLSDRSGSAQ